MLAVGLPKGRIAAISPIIEDGIKVRLTIGFDDSDRDEIVYLDAVHLAAVMLFYSFENGISIPWESEKALEFVGGGLSLNISINAKRTRLKNF